jgi:hypothetical protein
MTREQNIALIREKCIGANPETASRNLSAETVDAHISGGICSVEKESRVIRLADVLLAMDDNADIAGDYSVETDGTLMKRHPPKGMTDEYWGYTKFRWNLRKDDLTEQSDECLSFLAQLLN